MRVFGVGRLFDLASVEGRGWVIRECREDVRLGTNVFSPFCCSRVVGRLVSRVTGRWMLVLEVRFLNVREGPMLAVQARRKLTDETWQEAEVMRVNAMASQSVLAWGRLSGRL